MSKQALFKNNQCTITDTNMQEKVATKNKMKDFTWDSPCNNIYCEVLNGEIGKWRSW